MNLNGASAGTLQGTTIVRQNVYGYAAQLASFLSLLLFNILLPILLGPYLFGLLSLTVAIASVAIAPFHEAISLQAMGAARQSAPGGRTGADLLTRVCWLGFSLALAVGALIALSVPLLGPKLNVPPGDVRALYWAAPLALFMHLTLLFSNLLMVSLQAHWVALCTLLSGLTLVILPLAAFFLTHGSFWTVGGVTLSYAVVSLGVFMPLVKRLFPTALAHYPAEGPKWREIAGGTALYAGGSLFTGVLNSALLLLVSASQSVQHAAYFKIALSLTLGLVALIPAPKYTVLASYLHLDHSGNAAPGETPRESAQLETYLRLLSKYASAVTGLLLAGAFLLGPAFVGRLYGARFEPAASYVRWLILALPLYLGHNILVPLCWAQGKLRHTAASYTFAASVTLCAAWWMGTRGGVGAAGGYLLGLATMLGLTLLAVPPWLRAAFVRSAAKPLVSALPLMALALLGGLVSLSWLALLATGLGLVAAYIFILFLWRWFDWRELASLLRLWSVRPDVSASA